MSVKYSQCGPMVKVQGQYTEKQRLHYVKYYELLRTLNNKSLTSMNKLQAFFNRLMKYHDIDKTIKYEIQKDYEFIKNHSHFTTGNDRVQSETNRRTKGTDNTKPQSKHTTTTTNK